MKKILNKLYNSYGNSFNGSIIIFSGNYPHLLHTPYKAGPPCASCPHSCRSDKIK